MAAPTLTYSATVVTLPYPDGSGRNERIYEEVRRDRRTAAGLLRTSILSRHFAYQLTFRDVPQATYDALAALWVAATAAKEYPTFDFTTLFPSASAVAVSLGIGSARPSDAGGGLVDFTLSLVEVNPR